MNPKSGHRRAHYDEEGNIVIEPDAREEAPLLQEQPAQRMSRVHPETRSAEERMLWTVIEEDGGTTVRTSRELAAKEVRGVGTQVRAAAMSTVGELVREGIEQFRETGAEVQRGTHAFVEEVRKVGTRKIKKPKPRSRTMLFALDTLRFGGTFAAIFVFLFVAINFQSFWKIAKAELAIGQDLVTVQALADLTQSDAADRLQRVPSLAVAGEPQEDLVSYLPPVGPPENRLVIPKLGKNIPIVIPPIDSLITEDWRQFERDIQQSLRDGVVHYPGTAKPGQAGNFFITGHSSYYPWDSGRYKDVFARLHELDIGDTYSVYYGGDLHTYRVTDKFEVRPTNVAVLDQPTDKRKATLMTCTPIGTTLRRLIVQAEEIDPVTGKRLDVGEHGSERVRLPQVDMLPI